MKKVIYVFAVALSIAFMACKSGESSPENNSASSMTESTESGVSINNDAIPEESQLTDSTKNVQPLPVNNAAAALPTPIPTQNTPQVTQPQKPKMSPEEAEKYKESISLLRKYGQEMLNCLDIKNAGKEIDDAMKRRISEIQNRLTELQKAGKMNKEHIELFKATNDMYNQLLSK